MSDNTNRRQPEDKRFISLTEAWEISYWTKELGVTESQLRTAIAKVGNGTAAVKKYLGK